MYPFFHPACQVKLFQRVIKFSQLRLNLSIIRAPNTFIYHHCKFLPFPEEFWIEFFSTFFEIQTIIPFDYLEDKVIG